MPLFAEWLRRRTRSRRWHFWLRRRGTDPRRRSRRLLRWHLIACVASGAACFGGSVDAATHRGPVTAVHRQPVTTPHHEPIAAVQHPRVVVSLTFDDGFWDQMNAHTPLLRHRMRGTFFVNSSSLGQQGRLSWQDVHALAADGNEIGGHTVGHANLPQLPVDEQQREVCDDRVHLSQAGFRVTDFAYPYGASDATTERVAAGCGYNSARSTGGLRADSCAACDLAESVPPKNPFHLRAAESVITTTPLTTVEASIVQAEQHGGGWIILVFHNICDGCSEMAITPATFDSLLGWLGQRSAQGTVVSTVAEALQLPEKPTIPGPLPRGPGGHLINGSLESAAVGDGDAAPDGSSACWERTGFGTNNASWQRTYTPQLNRWTEAVSISSYADGDRKLLVRRDNGACSPRVLPNHSYVLGASYTSTTPTRLVVFYRNPSGHWSYWTSSGTYPAASGWQHVSWTTPPLPAGATRLSFGLQLAQVGTLATTNYSMAPEQPRNWTQILAYSAAGALALIVLIGVIAVRQRT